MPEIVAAADERALANLYRSGWEAPQNVRESVARILSDVRDRGDEALADYTRRFDAPAFDETKLRVPMPALEKIRASLPADVAEGLDCAIERVRDFHTRQLAGDIVYNTQDGTYYAFCTRPLSAVAAYVPGGTAVLPSSVVMSTVPAKVAGVERIVVLTPPRQDGTVAPAILYACLQCGVDEVYAAGGAQAIAAAAYGTQTLAPVDKIVGPGNVWVTEAKRQVFGVCGIDGLAGPSEVLVVADESAQAANVAAELLAQAEHDPLARVAAVSTSKELLEACARALDAREPTNREDVVANVLKASTYLIHARTREEVYAVIERFAPEHLSLQVSDPRAYLPRLRRVGAVFCGAHTPVAWGDYIAGTNHVLPTSGAARFSSGLRTADFQRTFSVVQNSEERAATDAPLVNALANYEGLPYHALTAARRS